MRGDLTLRREEALHQLELLANANRQVAESERIVAEWSELIGRMQAEGRDVTVARDLLETLRGNLEARRSSRDQIQQIVLEGAGRRPQPASSPA
jgi:hypothetical protein